MLLGEGSEGEHVGPSLGQEIGGVGKLLGELLDDPGMLGQTCSESGWAKIVRTKVATMAWADFGTLVSRLRMKWARHRCQLEPRVERTASTSPWWESEITRAVPFRPRATSPLRKASHPAPSSVVITSMRGSPVPAAFTRWR